MIPDFLVKSNLPSLLKISNKSFSNISKTDDTNSSFFERKR